MKKIIIIFVLIVALLFFLNKSENKIIQMTLKPVKVLTYKSKSVTQEGVKKITKKAKEIVYGFATKYNPPGDNLPDEVDDKILDKVKKIFHTL